MNKVILMGRLTKNPEVRYSQSAEPIAIARYTLAINRRFKRDNEPTADFINCVVFGKQAEFAERYFVKGMMISVSGRLQVSSWDDPQTGQKRWNTDVVVEEQEFAESKSAFENRSTNNSFGESENYVSRQNNNNNFSNQPEGFSDIGEVLDDEDLPF